MGEMPLTRVEVLIALLLLVLAGDSREALAAALRKAQRYGPILFSSSVTSQPSLRHKLYLYPNYARISSWPWTLGGIALPFARGSDRARAGHRQLAQHKQSTV